MKQREPVQRHMESKHTGDCLSVLRVSAATRTISHLRKIRIRIEVSPEFHMARSLGIFPMS